MAESCINIHPNVERVGISGTLIDIIVDKMVDEVTRLISRIKPDDDPRAEYGNYWSKGSYDHEDCLILDESYSDYDISYGCEISWEYRAGDEYWSDPACYRSYSDIRNQTGCVYGVEISTPKGLDVRQEDCEQIIEQVNQIIKERTLG